MNKVLPRCWQLEWIWFFDNEIWSSPDKRWEVHQRNWTKCERQLANSMETSNWVLGVGGRQECSRHLRHIILKLNHALKLHQQQLESLTIQLKRPQWRAKSYSFLQVKECGSQEQLPGKLPFREFDMPSVYEKEQCSEIYSIFKTASCWIQYLYSFLQ